MRKIDPNILAVASLFCATVLLIAGMYFSSFERNHAHDWPREQAHGQNITPQENDVVTEGLIHPELGGAIPQSNRPQSYPAYTNTQSLQHQDHKAQILMAVFTAIGLFIGGAGLYLIYRTLIETGSTAKAAADTLIEAGRSTKAAQEALAFEKGKHRPWINISSVEVNSITNSTSDVNGINRQVNNVEFIINIENIGPAPAFDVVCCGAIFLQDDIRNVSDYIERNTPFRATNTPSSVIGSGKKDSVGCQYFSINCDFDDPARIRGNCWLEISATQFQYLLVRVTYTGESQRQYVTFAKYMLSTSIKGNGGIFPDYLFDIVAPTARDMSLEVKKRIMK